MAISTSSLSLRVITKLSFWKTEVDTDPICAGFHLDCFLLEINQISKMLTAIRSFVWTVSVVMQNNIFWSNRKIQNHVYNLIDWNNETCKFSSNVSLFVCTEFGHGSYSAMLYFFLTFYWFLFLSRKIFHWYVCILLLWWLSQYHLSKETWKASLVDISWWLVPP